MTAIEHNFLVVLLDMLSGKLSLVYGAVLASAAIFCLTYAVGVHLACLSNDSDRAVRKGVMFVFQIFRIKDWYFPAHFLSVCISFS